MEGAKIWLVVLTWIISSAQADENKTNLQNQITSLLDIVQKVVSDFDSLRQQHRELEHQYHLLSDEFRSLRFNHIPSTKSVRTDEQASQPVHPKFAHSRSAFLAPQEIALDQKGAKSDRGLQREASIPGFIENNGQKGEKGDRGPKGDAGIPGFNGDDGYDGHKGEKGDPGIKGDAGISGFNGDDGIDGPKGGKGEPGNSGIQGQKGNTGTTGPGGHKGNTGDTGPTGQKGDTGIPGPAGQKGIGAPGTVGLKGDSGTPGLAGLKGDSGTPGLAGLKGTSGIQGPIGPTGLKGQKGLKGDVCPMDAQIAFYARFYQTINAMSNEVIAFPNIGTKIGTSYERSGLFTCKVTGIYVFTWSIEVNSEHTLKTLLMVNGSERGQLIVQGSVSNGNIGSTTVVIRLSVTDRVLILQDSVSPGTILGNSSSFSGFFLHPV
ncbi:otolin-1-like [Mizuhopecten yessoensis]|uniref:Collagen-like protein 2 n=1 Tax=Mizuhopecten yessoensis TaxID=6573 RepID=A0A210QXN0_MIZYE|nr:otolin-1-like [Mizuhopecten yessoensis]OWF53529.1 Collagen-like protein 2 [Mizuhopecten yessoensis]